jgi:hypothetical protein
MWPQQALISIYAMGILHEAQIPYRTRKNKVKKERHASTKTKTTEDTKLLSCKKNER